MRPAGCVPGRSTPTSTRRAPRSSARWPSGSSPTGASFADVALMGVVPRDGLSTPALVSGPGAQAFAARLRPLGMPVEVLGDEPGVAAARKLLRSVFMKGLAASCLESLRAARAAGCEDWMRAEIEAVLTGADAALLERLVTGSARHATRRIAEVARRARAAGRARRRAARDRGGRRLARATRTGGQ